IKALEEEEVVIRYNMSGKPSILFQNPELLDHIHYLVKYELANVYRYKEAIK
ncbi:18449_t:CDS:1, partial [Gigaspora margarita]